MNYINIINENTIAKKLNSYFKVLLAGSLVWGSLWLTPRVYNQATLAFTRNEVYSLIEKGRYDDAKKRFEGMEGKRFLYSSTIESERKSYLKAMKESKKKMFYGLINSEDYPSAKKLLEEFKGRKLLEEEDLKSLEERIEAFNPKRKIDLGDNSLGSLQVQRYESAKRDLDTLGQKVEGLETKLANAHLNNVLLSYGNNRESINSINAQIGDLIGYLVNHKEVKIDPENLDRFLEGSKKYLEKNIYDSLESHYANDYLSKLDLLLDSIGYKDKKQKIKELTQVAIRCIEESIKAKASPGEKDISNIESMMGFCRKYSPESLEGLVDIYFKGFDKIDDNPELSKNFLYSIMIYSSVIPKENKKDLYKKAADGYLRLARQVIEKDPKDALLFLETSRGLYQRADAGNLKQDSSLSEVESLIQKRSNLISDNDSNKRVD